MRRSISQHLTTGILCENSQGKKTNPSTGTAVACKPAKSKCRWTSGKSQKQFYPRLYNKNVMPKDRRNRSVQACAIEMHMEMAQVRIIVRKNLQEKCHAPRPGKPFGASLRNRNGHITKAFLRRLCATCALEMRMDIAQEQSYVRIVGKNARNQMEHPEQAPALTLTVRTP